MSTCECGRQLREDEKQCPACASNKSHWWKKVAEGVGTAVVVGAGIAIYVLSGGKGGKSA